jgi:hypothetical protein
MPATTTSFIASDGAHSLREKIGRALMWLAVLGAGSERQGRRC